MAPGALYNPNNVGRMLSRVFSKTTRPITALLNRSINVTPLCVDSGHDNFYVLEDGREIYDISGGAAVACVGKRNEHVENALIKVMRKGLTYVPSLGLTTKVADDFAKWMLESTGGEMETMVVYGSGSESSEAALKLVTQYFTRGKSPPEPERTQFIAREFSYHGNTLGALDASDHAARKALYTRILANNMRTIPACHTYRNRSPGQSDEEYVEWHKKALLSEIKASNNRIAAVLIEPVVGAALGCATAVPGYFRMIREVCDEYDIILIGDEIMCGMGRTGYLHTWQAEPDGVVPDIQLVGKSLAGGFQACSAMLVGPKLANALANGPSKGAFCHGHTFQNQAMPCAAGLATQLYIAEFGLLENVRKMGPLLAKGLRNRLGSHRYVGDIRGPAEGLFWGIEFVTDKVNKTPFPPGEGIHMQLFNLGLTAPHNIHIYPAAGCADHGKSGDCMILAPAYNIDVAQVDFIVDKVSTLIETFFEDYDKAHCTTV